MKPFEEATIPDLNVESLMARFGITSEQAEETLRRMAHSTVVMNDRYQVNITQGGEPFAGKGRMVWLSIKRLDKEPIHDWRDLQTIKNMLVGEDWDW